MDAKLRKQACSAIFHAYAVQQEAVLMLPVRRARSTTTDEFHGLVRTWFDGLSKSQSIQAMKFVKPKDRLVTQGADTTNVMALPVDVMGACRQIRGSSSGVDKVGKVDEVDEVDDEDAAADAVRVCAHAIGMQLRSALPLTEADDPNDDLAEIARILSREDVLDATTVGRLAFWKQRRLTADKIDFQAAMSRWKTYSNRISRAIAAKQLDPSALLMSGRLHMLFSPAGLLNLLGHLEQTAGVKSIIDFRDTTAQALEKQLSTPMHDEGTGFRDGNGQLDEDLLVLLPGRWLGLSPVEMSAVTYYLPEHSVTGDVCAYAVLINGHTGLPVADAQRNATIVPVVAGQLLASYTVMLEESQKKKTPEAPSGIWIGPLRQGAYLARQEELFDKGATSMWRTR